MNISKEIKLVTPRVKDHRGYTDMMFDMTVFVDFTDLETTSTIGYQILHSFDTEIEYDEDNPFVPFSQITEGEIQSLVNTLIEDERIGGQLSITEWAEKRFAEIYAQPVYKPFIFQIPPEPVGIGTSPVL